MPTLASVCPFPLPAFLDKDKNKEKSKEATTESTETKKAARKFPWVAFAGLSILALLAVTSIILSITLIYKFSSIFFFLLSLPFRGVASILWALLWIPLRFLFTLFFAAAKIEVSPGYSPALAIPLTCNNSIELQPWEVLNLLPGSDGNPKPVSYELNSPTPHAVSFVDIDYRDTRLDVFANGDYYGSTSDFLLDKSVYCGEDLNACLRDGFSTGTVVIPAGKKSVEITWAGKDVFPGTDKIVWGADRRRRVMWKKELCL